MARAEEISKARPKDELADEVLAFIKGLGIGFAAADAVAVVEDPNFAQLAPSIAKDLLLRIGTLKLLKPLSQS